MKKLPTVTIGIPAYNEEANIAPLITSLLLQRNSTFILKEIVVVSDASTDNTLNKLKNIKNPLLKVINNKKRLGLHTNQNIIVKIAKGDIFVLLDADVLPYKNFLNSITQPIVDDKKVGIVGANTIPCRPKKFFEGVLYVARKFKTAIYKKINNGNNLYLCHGRARAFNRSFYCKLKWPQNCPEDAYSYLKCIKDNYKFVFVSKAKVKFRLPCSLKEYLEKSTRFFSGKRELKKFFSKSLIDESYYIPLNTILTISFFFIIKRPLHLIVFLTLLFYTQFFRSKKHKYNHLWKISPSTKKVK